MNPYILVLVLALHDLMLERFLYTILGISLIALIILHFTLSYWVFIKD